MNHWLIIRAPGGVIYAWEVWPEGEPPDEAVINAARLTARFPAHDRYTFDESGWDIQLTLDRPHETLMERATVGTLPDLQAVDPAELRTYTEARQAYTREAQINSLRVQLMHIDGATLTQLLGSDTSA